MVDVDAVAMEDVEEAEDDDPRLPDVEEVVVVHS
jgi:hypothetical protein